MCSLASHNLWSPLNKKQTKFCVFVDSLNIFMLEMSFLRHPVTASTTNQRQWSNNNNNRDMLVAQLEHWQENLFTIIPKISLCLWHKQHKHISEKKKKNIISMGAYIQIQRISWFVYAAPICPLFALIISHYKLFSAMYLSIQLEELTLFTHYIVRNVRGVCMRKKCIR